MVDDYLSLLPVLVGGFLTIIGGIVSNAVLSSRSMKHEKRVIYRDKLEEIYKLTQSFSTLMTQYFHDEVYSKQKISVQDFNIERINMLVNLYHPWLKEKYTFFSVHLESCCRDMEQCYDLLTGNSYLIIGRSDDEKLAIISKNSDNILNCYQHFIDSSDRFLTEVELGFQKFV